MPRPFVVHFLLVLVTFSVFNIQRCHASLSLCASQNTGDESTLDVSIYQSNGLCENHCSGYAYAIVNGKSCYCSNYSPADTTDSSNCETECPGYPEDYCAGNSYFGYILLSTPSGTASASNSASSTSTASSTSPSSSFSQSSTSTTSSSSASSSSPKSSSTDSSSDSTSSSKSSPTTSSSSTTHTATSASPSVVTITGHVETVTVENPNSSATGSPTSNLSSSSLSSGQPASTTGGSSSSKSGFFSNKGKVAGTFTVVGLVALALIAFLIFFLCRRRRRDRDEVGDDADDGANSTGSYKEGKSSFNIIGSSPPLGSPKGGADGIKRDQSTATTLAGFGYDEKNGGFSKGGTIVPIVDQRLDPSQIFFNWNENNSRRSLQDEQDYSRRVLRVANPDE